MYFIMSTRAEIYVSNISNHPFKKDGSGFISKVDLDGKIVELNWVGKLNAPKGLTIVNDKLYFNGRYIWLFK